nr:uncharacterized protein LOC109150699 isoform X5 [Ipomoea trifida]
MADADRISDIYFGWFPNGWCGFGFGQVNRVGRVLHSPKLEYIVSPPVGFYLAIYNKNSILVSPTTQRPVVISDEDGGLLRFHVNEIPLCLGYWVVSNFKPSQMRLKLTNGSFISITKEDVVVVLGLPNGLVPILERDIQLLYVDRLVVGARDVPRSILVLDGWTMKLLKTREAREVSTQDFRHDMMDAPPHETHMPARFVSTLVEALHPQHAHGPSTVHPTHGRPSHMGFARDFDNATTELLSTVTKVVDMVHQQREQAHKDPNFMRLAETANPINGIVIT